MKQVAAIFTIVLCFFCLTACQSENAVESISIDANTKEILDSLGEDERKGDFLTMYNILKSLDQNNQNKRDKQIKQVNNIAEKWNLETVNYPRLLNDGPNRYIIEYFYGLVAPTYYEKSSYARNVLDINPEAMEQAFMKQGFRFVDTWGNESYRTKRKYYMSSDMKDSYFCSIQFLNKDSSFESGTVVVTAPDKHWSDSQYSEFFNLSFEKQQEFAYNSALENIQKIGNITEIPSLQVAFSEEELNALDWFFDQLDTEQLRQYDSLNTGETIDVNSVLITARLGNKEVGIRIGFAMNLLDITIFHKDRFSSEFEKNFSLLRHAFRDDPIPENKISNIVIDELYNARKKSNNNVIKQGRIEYINNDLGITLYLPSAWKDLYSVKESESGVTFYNTNNRDYGGLLFSIYYTDEVVDLCSSSKNVSKRSPKRLAPWST